MLKRILLFVALNIAILIAVNLLILVILPLFGVHIDVNSNFNAYALIVGFVAAFLQLSLSRWTAKMFMGVKLVDENHPLYKKVAKIAEEAEIKMPEVGIYDSPDSNAFATGPMESMSLVAVSTGLMRELTEGELEAVLAHEVAHIKNGDMVTSTLLQGFINTFVIILSDFIARRLSSDGERNTLVYLALQMVIGFLALPVQYLFYRYREYRADEGAAKLVGADKMISALQRLGGLEAGRLDPKYEALCINNGRSRLGDLFSTHPPIEKRIANLTKMKNSDL